MLANIEWNVATMSVAGVFAVPIVGIVSYFWCAAIKAKADSALKQTLAKRGMSVEEIERIVESGNRSKA